MDSIKGALKSRTVWFNIVTGGLEILNLFQGVVPAGTITAISVCGNVALRFLTTQPLADK